MVKPSIAVLCGGKSSFHTIQLLALENYLCGVYLGTEDRELAQSMSGLLGRGGMDFDFTTDKNNWDRFQTWIDRVKPDAIFCIAFPFKIPASVLELLPQRFINFHQGPLPQFRGAVPIFEVLRSGQKETAVCAHVMSKGLDEGDIIVQEFIPISEDDTFGSLAMKIAERTSLAAQNIARMLEFGSSLPMTVQEDDKAEYHPRPYPEDTLIRWHYMPAKEIVQLVNACNPWNTGADTILNNRPVKIISAEAGGICAEQYEPGTIISLSEGESLQIACIQQETLLVHIVSTDAGILPASALRRENVNAGHRFTN